MTDLLEPLTSGEEVTLRRIALGSNSLHLLPADHVSRLKRLTLIEGGDDGYRLTTLGRQCYAALPRPVRSVADASPAAAIEQMLSDVVQSMKTRKQNRRRQRV
jgi:hypothetical protein